MTGHCKYRSFLGHKLKKIQAAVMEKVRKHCEESLGHGDISLISTKQMNTFDGQTLIRQLLNTVQGKRLDGKF